MDYDALAAELLECNRSLFNLKPSRQLTQMVQGELFVLNYLSAHEAEVVHSRDISNAMRVSTARTAALLKSMEEKKWVTRRDDPRDNRQTIVCITEQGRESIGEARRRMLEGTVRMLEAIGAEDAENYVRIQRRIVAFFSQENS